MYNHPALLVVVAKQHQEELIEKANERRLVAEARRARQRRKHAIQPDPGSNAGRHWFRRVKNA